ncbi:potassium-transporting ATPase subunit KdpC [Staphylococcus saccharolyticus]|uniref:potassium-transporting ATPase subunit KdpC n=1 Tax=Staphylococcus saccharolyticus TaxID=33028 RepID=UPI0032DE6983
MQMIRKSFGLVFIMFILCGYIYPLVVTAAGQVIFSHQSNGSLVKQDGKVIGSKLIGQQWTSPKYFHGRPSAVNYNMNEQQVLYNDGPTSGGSNFANSNPALKQRVKDMIQHDGKHLTNDAVTASGSGLDPDITIENAKQQVARIAKARGIKKSEISHIIQQHEQFSPMTQDYVNVLKMNIALDHLK